MKKVTGKMTIREFFFRMIDAKHPEVSSTRFLTLVTALTILYAWVWASIYTRALVDIPQGVIYFAAVIITGKAVQSFSETKSK
jgi:hypothetical protein